MRRYIQFVLTGFLLVFPKNGIGLNVDKIDVHPHKVFTKYYGHLGSLFALLCKIIPHIYQDLTNFTNKEKLLDSTHMLSSKTS